MENDTQQPRKKPWYKRWWAICLWLFIAFAVIGSVANGSKDSDSGSSSSSATSSSSRADPLSKTYKVGDTISYKGYQIKVNKVSWSQGDDINKPDQGKQFCIVNVTLKNNDADDKWDYNPMTDFKLNDDGNNTDFDAISTDDNNQLEAGSLDKGASVTGDLIGQANPNAGKLQLQYQASAWDDSKTLNVNLK